MPTQKVTPFLWFKDNAEEAIRFYLSVFEGSRIVSEQRWGEGGFGPKGQLLTAKIAIGNFELAVLNTNPEPSFNDSFSLSVSCDTQAEIDRLWTKLTADGGEPGQCGWLKDKFGVSWQITPSQLPAWFASNDPAKSQRVGQVMMGMKKLDIEQLRKAHDGK